MTAKAWKSCEKSTTNYEKIIFESHDTVLRWLLKLIFFPSMFCITYPARGPPWERSNTCRGFNHQQNLCMSLAPWFPPLLGLMKTIRGFRSGEGMGLIINGRFSSLAFFRFIEARLFFRRDDLKDPWKSWSGFTIYVI